MLCGQTSLTTLPTGELTLRQLVLRYGNKLVWECDTVCELSVMSMRFLNVVLSYYIYSITIVSHLSDGKVDAVTFGTGTGGTLSG